ncbi:diguanylate cyclase [Pseudofrankia sp. BMG5.36]|uniref:diguanylate cyclase n=1 Tax=Pseudofrankia sp. BMG5.36 TaxID=1834512 RepID=UPI0008DAD6AE|nr:diguanylate cyclase [Pseudofrankia sp. BMG5.36]OHV47381.1 serine/threonine protein kinase [Pseudofrankia sp. BMG5.36]
MGFKRTTPSRDPPAAVTRTELLHETERTRVSRLVFPDGSVIRKEPLGPNAQRRLRHEIDILERLSGVEGVVRLAAGRPPCQGSVLLEDLGGTVLSERATPLDPAELIRLAGSLARAVAGMHRHGVVHRNINPANIVVSRGQDALCLIDFAVATTFVTVRPGFMPSKEIVGTIPYLAPEQTGRSGRPVDQRADLYAVGATLYELATGAPPFGTGDPLRIIHDHLARLPAPPAAVNPAVPAAPSAIIMHLLEKEPDDRYQSADGLLHDLFLLQRGATVLRPGEHDFPSRPLSTSRLAGRDREVGELGVVFADAMAGRCCGLLVAGAPGVGKTSLVNELRPIVAGSDGWFVAGKFDQFRRDQEHDAIRQAFRALGRLLLAEPEDNLAEVRDRMRSGLGPNAGLAAAVVPEVATLLKVPPEPGDPMTAQARVSRAVIAIMRAVASRKRPVVLFLDDLQWAGRTPLGFVDLIFGGEEQIEGLLLVGAYRERGVDAAHPLTRMLARWRRQPAGPHHVWLGSLSPRGQAAMVADLLHLAPRPAAELAGTIAPTSAGNPYNTLELLNTLRHGGALAPSESGWRWDRETLRRQLGRMDVTDLLVTRTSLLPPDTREVLAVMACLAGQVELDVLEAATALPTDDLSRRLAPAFADGLLVLEPGDPASLRFHHDRAQESILRGLTSQTQRATRLRLARRLAGQHEFSVVAAEQYLHVIDAVHAAEERQLVVRLFKQAADEAKLLSNHSLVERFLAAAIPLVDTADVEQRIMVHTDRHAALYGLGRLEEADEEYQTISRLCTHPAERTAATVVQVSSLTDQGRPAEAVRLGLDQLRQLGLAAPDRGHIDKEIDRRLDALYRWLDETSEADDRRRPRIADRSRLGTINLINRLMAPAFYCDQTIMAWLTVETLEMWTRYGPDPTLLGPAAHAALVVTARRHDYRTGYRMMRRILTVGRERGYEPDVWRAEFLYLMSAGHWFESLEENVSEAHRALEGLIQAGDLQSACWTHYVLIYNLLDCAPSLGVFVAEIDEALAFARRTGNGHAEELFLLYRQLARLLRGEVAESAADEAAVLGGLADSPYAAARHITRALAAAILDDPVELARHMTAVTPLLPYVEPIYAMANAHLLRALALAWQARSAETGRRGSLLAELDKSIEWLAARAADAPVNFLHLLRLVKAERAWAAGDFQEAAYTYDVAQRDASVRVRPWHRALILERCARFYLTFGMEEAGSAMLAAARREYLAWGANAKVSQLDWAFPMLRAEPAGAEPAAPPPGEPAVCRSTVTTGIIDLLSIVAASQALSSETSIEGLRAKVVGILSAMTGATGVHLLLSDQQESRWSMPADDGRILSLPEASQRRLLPASVIRYAERTREPVVVDDATHDDRFNRDPYFADPERCSMLAVPIMTRGRLGAMLLLENRMIRGAFSTERLEGIMLIAGQLAVSLDNAQIYASLERKVAERTQQLAAANQRLEQLSITDPLTGLANRRRLDEVLNAEWYRATQPAAPIALAMIDIDHFKPYNDNFGHTAGDRCLQRVTACLSRNTRGTDLAARYGGEEFAVVMPGAELDIAARIAHRLRSAVEEMAEPHPFTAEHVVTVSVGVASIIPTRGVGPADLVELADAQLYRAKSSGRNRVEVALSTPSP